MEHVFTEGNSVFSGVTVVSQADGGIITGRESTELEKGIISYYQTDLFSKQDTLNPGVLLHLFLSSLCIVCLYVDILLGFR